MRSMRSVPVAMMMTMMIGGGLFSASIAGAQCTVGAVFGEMWSENTGPIPTTGLVAGDLNGDGWVDLAGGSLSIEVRLNDGAGGFLPPQVQSASGRPLTFADFDADGDNDLLTTMTPAPFESPELVVLLNDGNGAFTVGQTVAMIGTGGSRAVAADLDGDGDTDVAHFQSEQVLIALNDGTGTLLSQAYPDTGMRNDAGTVADVNGDGAWDLLVITSDWELRLLLNQGDGTFGPATVIASDVHPQGDLLVTDFDGDGDRDVVGTSLSPPSLMIVLNQGDGEFDAPLTGMAPPMRGLHGADFDGDGDLDFVSVFPDAVVALNEGGGVVSHTPLHLLQGQTIMSSTVGDVDGDGASDLLVSCEDTDPCEDDWLISILLNGCASAAPTIVAPPASVVVDARSPHTVNMGVEGSRPLTYEWRRNGQPFEDGDGVDETLSFSSLSRTDTDVYDCVISNAFGTVVTPSFIIGVRDTCPPDLTNDGGVNVFDLLELLGGWGGCP